MHKCHRAVALWESHNRVATTDFGTNVFGNATVANNVVALTVKAGCGDGIADAHVEVDEVENRRQHGRDDA